MAEDEKQQKRDSSPRRDDRSEVRQSDSPSDLLSSEEQMARFEEALKDEDWGHQPC